MAIVQNQPAPFNGCIARKQGENRPITLRFSLNGESFDFTGAQFTVTVAKSPNSVPIYKGVTTIQDGTSGFITLPLPKIATTAPPGNYAMEIRYLTPGGIDQVVLTASLLLQASLSLS